MSTLDPQPHSFDSSALSSEGLEKLIHDLIAECRAKFMVPTEAIKEDFERIIREHFKSSVPSQASLTQNDVTNILGSLTDEKLNSSA